MKIIWSRKAASSFHQIETYILNTFGEKTQRDDFGFDVGDNIGIDGYHG